MLWLPDEEGAKSFRVGAGQSYRDAWNASHAKSAVTNAGVTQHP